MSSNSGLASGGEYALSVLTAAQAQAVDRIAINEIAIPGYELMKRAGVSASKLVAHLWPRIDQVVIVCGSGNNGGDGFVLAKCLKERGLGVQVFLISELARVKGDARLALDDAENQGVSIKALSQSGDKEALYLALQKSLEGATLIVDAILGTGTIGTVRKDTIKYINLLNCAGKPILSLDIPSGMCADTGCNLGEVIEAKVTLTFIALKRGLITGNSVDHVGELYTDDLQIPDLAFERMFSETLKSISEPMAVSGSANDGEFKLELISYQNRKSILKPRKKVSHKGSYGHVLLVGGGKGMGGAIVLAAEAALRSGAGLVSVATHPDNAAMVTSCRPEIMCKGIEHPSDLDALIQQASVLVLGPGLGTDHWAEVIFKYLILGNAKKILSDIPKVVDADGLNLISNFYQSSTKLQSALQDDLWVLSPHPGEAARLLGITTAEINRDRYRCIQTLQQRFGGIVVLKGVGSLVANDKEISVCVNGNPGMASGGMGDTLSGILAGLLAQRLALGLSCKQVADLAVVIHSFAADLAASEIGERGLIASDLMTMITRLVNPE